MGLSPILVTWPGGNHLSHLLAGLEVVNSGVGIGSGSSFLHHQKQAVLVGQAAPGASGQMAVSRFGKPGSSFINNSSVTLKFFLDREGQKKPHCLNSLF